MYGGGIEAEGGFTLEFGSRQDDPGFLWADLASLQSPPSHVALPFSRPAWRPTGARFFTRGRLPRVSRSSPIATQLPWT